MTLYLRYFTRVPWIGYRLSGLSFKKIDNEIGLKDNHCGSLLANDSLILFQK